MGRPKSVLPPVAPGPVGTDTAPGASSRRLRGVSRLERWHGRRLDGLADRMERRRERLRVRWEKVTRQRRRDGLAIRIRHRWYLLTERIEPLVELVQIRWYRLVYRVAAGWGRALLAVGASVALAAALIALLPLGAAAPSPTKPSHADRSVAPEPSIEPTPDPETVPIPDPSSALSTYTNELAGYSFLYPSDWDVSTSGTGTILSDPESRIEISFDGAPDGSLQQTSDEVLDQLTNAFGSPETIATEVNRTSQGYRSLAVGGTARGATGAQIRFLAITIRGPDENRAIVVRFPADTVPSELDVLLVIVDSFRIAPAS